MSLASEITALETDLKTDGISVDAVLVKAGVDRSTWTRWKNGSVTGARYDTMQKVRSAAAALRLPANDSSSQGEAA